MSNSSSEFRWSCWPLRKQYGVVEFEQASGWMKISRAALVVAAALIAASCSEKKAPEREKYSNTPEATRAPKPQGAKDEDESEPREDEIGEDCVTFVRSTRIVPAQTSPADCPTCPAEGAEALSFRQMKTDRISCAGDTCTVLVTIRVAFKPGVGERIAGGLTAWISPEQRSEYLSGHPPSGEQAYRVQITYKRRGEAWRAVDFDRAPAE
jgi:DNA-directed RNA polymerase subunit M/transcription elongation factor TFIIS